MADESLTAMLYGRTYFSCFVESTKSVGASRETLVWLDTTGFKTKNVLKVNHYDKLFKNEFFLIFSSY